ncbi:hypothetical protein DOY81_002494, partial [Sarcophaga bullata]
LLLFIYCAILLFTESLTTTYSTSYSSSLDVTTTTTTVSPTNLLPYFDFDVPRNITVTVGQTGFLHCRVERLGDKDLIQYHGLVSDRPAAIRACDSCKVEAKIV